MQKHVLHPRAVIWTSLSAPCAQQPKQALGKTCKHNQTIEARGGRAFATANYVEVENE